MKVEGSILRSDWEPVSGFEPLTVRLQGHLTAGRILLFPWPAAV
jgi:hypothetical protein